MGTIGSNGDIRVCLTGYPRLEAVIEKALDMGCFDVEAVRLLLDAKGNRKREPQETVENFICVG